MPEADAVVISLTTTEIVAWWGAILATFVFAWDVYKWRTSGPRLRVTVRQNQVVIGDPEREGGTFIYVKATNVGDRPTTLTGLGFHVFKNRISRLQRNSKISAVISNPNLRFPLPHILEPGHEWGGLMDQSAIAKCADGCFVEVELSHSHSVKPIWHLMKLEMPSDGEERRRTEQ